MNPLLQQYVRLTDFLGQTLGPDFEIALHDLTNKERSIVAIVNNHISGREVGAPLTGFALQILRDRSYESSNYRLHYNGISAAGKKLRSSTFFIKDNGHLIGMLCVNFDDTRYEDACRSIMELCHPNTFIVFNAQIQQSGSSALSGTSAAENALTGSETAASAPAASPPSPAFLSPESFPATSEGVAAEAVSRELARLGVSAERLTAGERLRIIETLEAGGIFLLKGAVKDVAAILHCSPVSVYRYISQSKKKEHR